MNRKNSFERHKKNCKDRIKGAKTKSFQPNKSAMAGTAKGASYTEVD